MGNVRPTGARGIVRALATTFAIAAGSWAIAAPPALDFTIEVLSSRPDKVAGGDALVRVEVPRNVPMHQAAITLNGVDITASPWLRARSTTARCSRAPSSKVWKNWRRLDALTCAGAGQPGATRLSA